jgi:hypothetical protein
MPKIEPAVRQLYYIVPDGTTYIDLAKDLSKVNRRLYRQGMSYVVQDIQLGMVAGMQATDVYQISFSTAGNSWIVHNAWKKGFAAWRGQVREVENMTGIKAGSWNDFKVYLDDSMEDGTTLEPYAADGAVYSAGEWEYSALVFDDDGTERDLKMHLIGSSNLADTNEESGIGLVNEYSISRSLVQANDPDVPSTASDSIYAKLMGTDEMTDRIVDNVETANDNPPYHQNEYPGGATNADVAVPVRIGSVNATQSSMTIPGFVAECGLIKVSTNEIQLDGGNPSVYEVTSAPTAVLIITVAPGPYRGVLLFVLWQTGTFIQAYSYVQGGMC